MDNENIFEKVVNESDSLQRKSATELRQMLDDELKKPSKERDYSVIDELTTSVIEAEGNNRLTVDVNEKLNQFNNRFKKNDRKIHYPRWVSRLSIACVMLFCANCISVLALNMNIVSAVVRFTKGGFTVNFDEIIDLPVSEDDPYGIVGKCEEIGIHVETPHYIPDGFVLTQIGTDNDNHQRKCIGFVYKKENQLINITFDDFMNGKVGIPSDHYNISEMKICGHTTIVSKEDNQMIAVFHSGDFDVIISTINVDYSECDKILDSIK